MGTFAVNGLFIAVTVVTVVFAVVGLFRGFLKSVLSLFAFIVAIIATMVFAPVITDTLCESKTVMEWTAGLVSGVESVVTDRVLSDSGIVTDEIKDIVKDVPGDAADGLRKIVFDSEAIARKIISVIVYVGLYIILRLVLWIFCLIVSFVRELPGVKGTDMVLGAILGLVRVLLLIGLFFFGFSVVYSLGIGQNVMDMIEENAILALMYKYNAVGTLINTVLHGV